ncbi:hypothetical protein E8D37_18110 [Nocardioides sp. GY 10127]|nr:hypothetical protein E8D37_18110 [Nocardioides sp. GY 10127]
MAARAERDAALAWEGHRDDCCSLHFFPHARATAGRVARSRCAGLSGPGVTGGRGDDDLRHGHAELRGCRPRRHDGGRATRRRRHGPGQHDHRPEHGCILGLGHRHRRRCGRYRPRRVRAGSDHRRRRGRHPGPDRRRGPRPRRGRVGVGCGAGWVG